MNTPPLGAGRRKDVIRVKILRGVWAGVAVAALIGICWGFGEGFSPRPVDPYDQAHDATPVASMTPSTQPPAQGPNGEAAQADPDSPNQDTGGQCLDPMLPPCNVNVYLQVHLGSTDFPCGDTKAYKVQLGLPPVPDGRLAVKPKASCADAVTQIAQFAAAFQWYAVYVIPKVPNDGLAHANPPVRILMKDGQLRIQHGADGNVSVVGEAPAGSLPRLADTSDIVAYGLDPTAPIGTSINQDNPVLGLI